MTWVMLNSTYVRLDDTIYVITFILKAPKWISAGHIPHIYICILKLMPVVIVHIVVL